MTTQDEEIIELGKKALAKKKRKEQRDKELAVVATKFVELCRGVSGMRKSGKKVPK